MEALNLTLTIQNGRQQWADESILTRWMHENARVAQIIGRASWDAEVALLKHATLALNIDGRSDGEFARSSSARRSTACAAVRRI